jgi:hypothetical protein
MSPRYIGVNPGEIIWSSLRISWWQKVIRRYAVLGFITALIVFWAIPVAAVGFISNVNNLVSYKWLAWINNIPSIILGVVTGLLPSVMLAILMSLVPIIMRRKLPTSYNLPVLTINSLRKACWRTQFGPC